MRTSEQVDKIMPELVGLYEELDNLVKDADNPFFKSKYVEYDTANEHTRPLLSARGLWMHRGMNDACTLLITRIWHKSGQWVETSVPYLEPRAQVNKDNRLIEPTPQDAMKSLSYSMRYGHFAVLGMVPKNEDDDGNSASKRKKKKKSGGGGGGDGWFVKGDGKVMFPNTFCAECGVEMPQGSNCEIRRSDDDKKWLNRHPGGECAQGATPPPKDEDEGKSPTYARFGKLCNGIRASKSVDEILDKQDKALADMKEREFPEHLIDGFEKMCAYLVAKMQKGAEEGS